MHETNIPTNAPDNRETPGSAPDPTEASPAVADLARRTKGYLEDPANQRAIRRINPMDLPPGSALPRCFRGVTDPDLLPRTPHDTANAVRRLTGARVLERLIHQVEQAHGWKFTTVPPTLRGLQRGEYLEPAEDRVENGWVVAKAPPEDRAVTGHPREMFRRAISFSDSRGPVAVLAFPKATLEEVRQFAVIHRLIAHVAPTNAKYWPTAEHLGLDAPTPILWTRTDVPAVSWPVDGTDGPDWSPISPEEEAELGRLQAEEDAVRDDGEEGANQ